MHYLDFWHDFESFWFRSDNMTSSGSSDVRATKTARMKTNIDQLRTLRPTAVPHRNLEFASLEFSSPLFWLGGQGWYPDYWTLPWESAVKCKEYLAENLGQNVRGQTVLAKLSVDKLSYIRSMPFDPVTGEYTIWPSIRGFQWDILMKSYSERN